MLRHWIKELSDAVKTAFPGNGSPRDEEVARLSRRIADLHRQSDGVIGST